MANDIARYHSKHDWETKNPLLRNGEPGFEEETGKLKIGDGVKHWNALPYQNTPPFTLPKPVPVSNTGPKGDIGPTGPTGPQGPKGDPGSAASVTDANMAAAYGAATGAKVAADPLLKAAYGRSDVVAPAPTGVAATDTANLLAAIAATPAGGTLFLPAKASTVYALNAALVLTKSINIIGQQMTETWAGTQTGGALNHPVSPGVSGAVLQQNTAATDVIRITGSGAVVNLTNLGLTFGPGVINTNTGHGINGATTVTPAAGGHDTGPISFTWKNITVYGHDGNHYAAVLLNSMYYTLEHFHSYGGGTLSLQCDSFVGNYGNGVFIEPYGEVYNAGTADGFNLQCRASVNGGATGTGTLGLLTFIRPQCNVTNAAATQGTQKAWNSLGGAALPTMVDVMSPDLEINPTSSGSSIDFGGIDSGTVVHGGFLSKPPVNGYSKGVGRDHRIFTATTTWYVPRNVYEIRVRAIAAGGGGGGGGTNAAAAANVGGAGGGAGTVVEATVSCTPGQSFVFTIGTGGTAGAAGVAGGNAGGTGGNGGNTTVSNTPIAATGGGGGAGGGASSTTAVAGGYYGRGGNTSLPNTPGFGGNAQSPNGLGSVHLPPGVVGGGGGGASSTTLGGGGGGASTYPTTAYAGQSGGSQGTSGTVNGVAGTTAVTPGCGGGGGGGALTGGAGGAGGAGAPGQVEIWY